jgi:hypothetical protein
MLWRRRLVIFPPRPTADRCLVRLISGALSAWSLDRRAKLLCLWRKEKRRPEITDAIDLRHGRNPPLHPYMNNEQGCHADHQRGHLSRLRTTDDAPAHNQACLRRKLERVQMQAVRVFNDRARKLDNPSTD